MLTLAAAVVAVSMTAYARTAPAVPVQAQPALHRQTVAGVAPASKSEPQADTAQWVPPPDAVPMPDIAAPTWIQRGTIVNEAPMPEAFALLADKIGDARRATYRSVSGLDGRSTDVTGSFFIPKGSPPPGGWPVVSLAHSTIGLSAECGLSQRADLAGYAPAIASMLSGGVALALTDYQGLGGPGEHPYLEPRTAGFNVIDAVRATRALFPDIGTRWLAYGHSQGGQAAWAADELAGFYGDGLKLLGSVALAPPVNMTKYAELAYDEGLTQEQLMVAPLVATAAERSYPEVPVENLIHGQTLQRLDELLGCAPDADAVRAEVADSADVKPDSRADADALTRSLQKLTLPQRPALAPLLVVSGSDDETVPAQWIRAAVTQSCEMGTPVEYFEQPGARHGDVGTDLRVTEWVVDRLTNKPAASNCSTL